MRFQTLPSGSLLSSFRKRSKLLRTTSSVLLFTMVSEIVIPTTAYALGGGPGAIDYASFEPVGTTDMVNVFTGEFNYNLPVLEVPSPDGDGYGLALSYHSGTNAESEASWVGYGFGLNAGAVSRATRNLPDEYKGDNITQYNKVRANWTSSIKEAINAKVVS